MDKMKIEREAPRSEPIWAHLIPVLEYAVEQGCRFKTGNFEHPFTSTKNGLMCHMNGSVSMEDLDAKFALPPTIEFGGPHNHCLWDKRSNITLCIHRG